MRHRRLPFTAGDWHAVPERVRARQRGALASRSGCVGLFAGFDTFVSPPVMVKLVGNDGLPAFAHMHVTHGLLARLVQLGKRLQ